MSIKRVLLVDDHPVFRDGFKDVVNSRDGFEVKAVASSVAKAKECLSLQSFDLLVCDIELPDGSGLDVMASAKEKNPLMKILALSMFHHPEMIHRAMKIGVNGYAVKDSGRDELIKALSMVQDGQKYFSSTAAQSIAHSQLEGKTPLTDREIEIIRLISQDKSNKQIAEDLFISVRTVETHRKNIFKKTDTNTVVGLLNFVYKHKIV